MNVLHLPVILVLLISNTRHPLYHADKLEILKKETDSRLYVNSSLGKRVCNIVL